MADSEVELVQHMFEAFARRDLEVVLPLLHPDVELRVGPTAELAGHAGPYRGHDGIRQYARDVDSVWEQLELHPEDYRAVAGSVVIFGRVSMRRQGVSGEARVTWIWKLRDGQVISGAVFPAGTAGS